MPIENETESDSNVLALQTKRSLRFPLSKPHETQAECRSQLATEEEMIAELLKHSGNWSVKFSAAVYQFAADDFRTRSTTHSLRDLIETACFKAVELRLSMCPAARYELSSFEQWQSCRAEFNLD